MANDVTVKDSAALPAFLQGGRKATIGNVDQSDMIMPRVKLLQKISKECDEFESARDGLFWHSIELRPMGQEVRFIPLLVRKSYILWAPRGDQRGILARALDGVHWDNRERFEVKPKGAPQNVIWDTTSGTVAASRLGEFGTSIPGDDKSVPAATLTYEIVGYAPEQPELSPFVVLCSRSAIKPAQKFLTTISAGNVDHYGRVFLMKRFADQSPEGPFWNYQFVPDGFVQDAATFEMAKGLYERFASMSWRANDEAEEAAPVAEGNVGGSGRRKI